MRIEAHQEAFNVHKKAIFTWALDIEGLDKAQRIVGLHASRGIIELFSIFLHKKNLIDEGFQVNHRWFKSENAGQRFPQFQNKENIISKMIKLEILCENLAYGAPKPTSKTEEAIELFKELEELINQLQ